MSPCSNGNEIHGVPRYDQTLLNSAVPVLFKPIGATPGLEGENNLPLGIQLIGNKYDDHRFLGVARWLEKKCEE